MKTIRVRMQALCSVPNKTELDSLCSSLRMPEPFIITDRGGLRMVKYEVGSAYIHSEPTLAKDGGFPVYTSVKFDELPNAQVEHVIIVRDVFTEANVLEKDALIAVRDKIAGEAKAAGIKEEDLEEHEKTVLDALTELTTWMIEYDIDHIILET